MQDIHLILAHMTPHKQSLDVKPYWKRSSGVDHIPTPQHDCIQARCCKLLEAFVAIAEIYIDMANTHHTQHRVWTILWAAEVIIMIDGFRCAYLELLCPILSRC